MDDYKERTVLEIAGSLRVLMSVVKLMPEGTLKETLMEEIRHLDFCMSVLFPIEEKTNE